jgi:hypothetical protein
MGDRFYKLSHKYYGDVELWWVIPWFNQIATEIDVSLGDILEIPFPLETVLRIAKF